ncbi:WD repeat-containing protein vip3 [Castilleja foliolosa]|uniref:WD repeat-containing protein vip3 n=1 Tax=Castilleja foliolosa TaxID=1961234 RepID=A0ABD3DN44_9LAMI
MLQIVHDISANSELRDSGPLLLTGSLDETVRLWNHEGPEKVQTNTGHCLSVVSVAAHPFGRNDASASIDSVIRVFDVATNNTIATLETPPSEVWQLQFNPQLQLGEDDGLRSRVVNSATL